MKRFYATLAESVARALGVETSEVLPLFASPPDPALGDISLPCFPFAKRRRKAPPAIAEELAARAAELRAACPWISSVRAAGPYANFTLDSIAFAREVLGGVARSGDDYGRSNAGSGLCVVIDYSSPNIAKHLAVHHLRSTMIGNAIANLHRALGYTVVGINHLGDWGTTFGKLLCAWERFGSAVDLEPLEKHEDPLSLLNDLYVRFHEEAERRPELEEEARAWFRRLETGDPVARRRWQEIRDVSWQRFQRVYRRLGVVFEEVIGESFFEALMPAVVTELGEKKLLAESDDARVVFLDAWGMPPMLIMKKDGATLYGTRDLAAADYRWQRWRFHRAYYVVDAGQSLHFRQLFRVLDLLGRSYADKMVHLEFGVMRLPVDGSWVRGKTRKGQVVLLEQVLDRARELAREKVLEKNPGLENVDEAAEAVGMASVIFADLKAKRIKDVNFDLDQITSFDGETGAYLQYTHVRFCGILRNYSGLDPVASDGARLGAREEILLLKEIARYPEILEWAREEGEPSVLSHYLLGLASLFNAYYATHRILDPDPAIARDRVALVRALRVVLANGLRILGIRPLERM